MITLESGAELHKKLFPKATLESQAWKLEEEVLEYEEASATGYKPKITKELADVVVVTWGLFRFIPSAARGMFTYAYDKAEDEGIFWGDVLVQAEKKWRINEGRTWKFDGKVYHHVGKDGEE